MSVASVRLSDPSIGSEARVLVGFGFNCYSFVARDERGPVELLWSEAGFESGEKRPSGSGVPLLFPFPGRLDGDRFTHQGRTFELEAGDGRGNAIHGFVLSRPWRIVDQSEQHVTGQFRASTDEPALLDCWPAEFEIQVTYRLGANTLTTEIVVRNPSETDELPWGLGTHPYFRLPLGEEGGADACRVHLPVTSQWELAGMLPTGRRLPLEDAESFEAGLPFADLALDNVFSGLQPEGGPYRAEIVDEAARRAVWIEFDAPFRECVVYNPPHRQAICIEPYSCVPGAQNIDGCDNGWRTLPPGESIETRIGMGLRSLG